MPRRSILLVSAALTSVSVVAPQLASESAVEVPGGANDVTGGSH